MKIGLDGGGSKTAGILVDDAGRIVAERRTRGCSPSLQTRAAIHQVLDPMLAGLRAHAHQAGAAVTHTVLCMAGSPLFWREWAADLSGCGAVQTHDDSIPVLELATAGRPGLVLHAGTGSFVAARGPDGAAHYAGGLGWRLGDPGSAHDLGRRAVARTLLELQGWVDASALGRAVCAAAGHDQARSLTRYFYQHDDANTLLAGLAPLVTAGAAAQDPAAVTIVGDSVTALAELARAVTARLFPAAQAHELPLGLSGAILQLPLARAAIAAALPGRWAWRGLTEPPIEGVRRLLIRI
jgi:N-acetylglucosamine kinase-like BadF-type ATPase